MDYEPFLFFGAYLHRISNKVKLPDEFLESDDEVRIERFQELVDEHELDFYCAGKTEGGSASFEQIYLGTLVSGHFKGDCEADHSSECEADYAELSTLEWIVREAPSIAERIGRVLGSEVSKYDLNYYIVGTDPLSHAEGEYYLLSQFFEDEEEESEEVD